MFDELIEKTMAKSQQLISKNTMDMINTCNFHIGRADNGKIVYNINGRNPAQVITGWTAFEKVLKHAGIIKEDKNVAPKK